MCLGWVVYISRINKSVLIETKNYTLIKRTSVRSIEIAFISLTIF